MKLNLSHLNKQQKQAVTWGDSPVMVIAGSGSGKTRVLTYRVAHLIKKGYLPSRLFVTTFTNQAADEMRERLEKLVGVNKADRLKIGTFHSLCYGLFRDLLESKGEYDKPKLIMGGGQFMTILMIINQHAYDSGSRTQKKSNRLDTKDIKEYLSQISFWKNEGKRLKDIEKEIKKDNLPMYNGDPKRDSDWGFTRIGSYYKVYAEYQKVLKEKNKLDFDDMLFRTYYELIKKKNKLFLERKKKRLEHILVDEAQDLNKIQFMLVRILAGDNRRITIAGDDYQCQPTGAMIAMEGGWEQPIEDMRKCDKVVSYNKESAYFTGINRNANKITAVQQRKYVGRMFKIKVGKKSTNATPEHDWLVRFNNKSTKICVVYMMQKDNKFRIGWCQLFYNTGSSHILQRMRIERADKIWILKVCKTRKKASLWESIIAAKFSLPLIIFEPTNNAKYYDRQGIDFVFSKLGNLENKARKCLEHFKRQYDLPFYYKGQNVNRSGSRIFKITTSNLLPGIMSVPVFGGNAELNWEPVELETYHYNGYVYSLAVSGSHTYIADGIATHNCIYGFRGSRVENLINFGKEYKATIIRLEQNYRSTKHIVEYGNVLIKHNTVQIWKNLFTKNDTGNQAHVMLPVDVEDEADKVVEKIEDMILDGYELNDIAVMFRTNAQSRAIVDRFIIQGIPHKVYSKEGFYDRKEVKDMLSYLRICSFPYEAEPSDFQRIVNRPARFIANKFIDTVEEYMVDNDIDSFYEALKHWPHMGLTAQQQGGARRFLDDITYCNEQIENIAASTKEAFDIIIEKTGYLRWFNKEEDEKSNAEPDNDKKMNLDSLLTGAERFVDIEKYLMFIDSMDYEDLEEEDAIHVLTCHRSKGKEFPVVFIIGCCEGVMPHNKADDIEEERRICYVAVTRAKEDLYISGIDGKFNRNHAEPSRFMHEMKLPFPKRIGMMESRPNPSMIASATGTYTKYDESGKVIEVTPLTDDSNVNSNFSE